MAVRKLSDFYKEECNVARAHVKELRTFLSEEREKYPSEWLDEKIGRLDDALSEMMEAQEIAIRIVQRDCN